MDDVDEVLDRARAATMIVVADLEAELSAIAESTAESPDDEHDAEGATIGFERARVGALLDRARHSLAEIDDALERSRAGTYGFCDRCGGVIPVERLEALPTTSLCVSCAAARHS